MHPDRALAIVLLLLSAGYLGAVFLIPQPSGQYATVGPRAFPLAVGIGLVICSVVIGLQARGQAATSPIDWPRLAGCALLFLAYLTLFEAVGYLLTTAAFITLQARLLGSPDWPRNALAGVVVTAAVYALLDLLLGMPLPSGLLG